MIIIINHNTVIIINIKGKMEIVIGEGSWTTVLVRQELNGEESSSVFRKKRSRISTCKSLYDHEGTEDEALSRKACVFLNKVLQVEIRDLSFLKLDNCSLLPR